MRNFNQLRIEGETMEQFKARRARGMAINLMSFMAECREGAGWGPAKAEMIRAFHYHRARLHTRLALAPLLP